MTLGIRLVSRLRIHVCVSFPLFFFLAACFDFSAVNSAPVHCSRVPQTPTFSNFFIKNESHDTIHTFKNYFVTVFSISAKYVLSKRTLDIHLGFF